MALIRPGPDASMFRRRDLLKIAMTGLATPAALIASSAFAQTAAQPNPAAADPRGPKFDSSQVLEAARALARQPWRKPAHDLSDAYSAINFEQYAAIRRRIDLRPVSLPAGPNAASRGTQWGAPVRRI